MTRAIFFLVLVALAATVSAVAPLTQPPYRTVEEWGTLPQGMILGEVAGMAIDVSGRLFAFRRNDPPIVEFDAAGTVQKTWGAGLFVWPQGMRIDRHGFLWLTDGRGRNGKGQQVFKYTRDGQLVMTLGTAGVAGDGPDTFNGPTDVAVAPNGDIFVADGHVNSRIVRFSKDGRFIKTWGTKGTGPGEFDLPHSVFFDSRGRLFVGDRSNKRIQIFDQDGGFIDQWTQFGSPSAIFITADDTLYVVDDDIKRLLVGSATDGSITHAINNLTLAEAVAVDGQGSIYVGQTVPGRTAGGTGTGPMVRKLMKN